MLPIEDTAVTRAHLCEHIKRCTSAFGFGCFSGGDESRQERVVETQTGNMSSGVNTETVHTHVNERSVALYQIVIHSRVLRIQIHAVSGNLEEPAVRFVPVTMSVVMPVVMRIVVLLLPVLVIRVLHLRQPCRILFTAIQLQVVVGQQTAVFLGIRYHAVVDGRLIGRPITIEQLAQVGLTEVTGVIQHDIHDDLHSPFMRLVYHRLKTDALRLMSVIDLREVVCMVTVVIIAGRILHDRRDPDSGETQRFDVIHLLYQTFEITPPSRVTGILRLVVPTLRVVRRITVVETGRQQKINLLIAKIGTGRIIRSGKKANRHT